MRSLRKQELVECTPKKKPKLHLQRYEAELPNEALQSDFTYVTLQNGNDILVLNFLHDHSRHLLSCTAHRKITSPKVVEALSFAAQAYGLPQSSPPDNGLVYSTTLLGGKNAYEIPLARLGVEQKNSRSNHTQAQGKIERFHQTLKKWLAARPKVRNLSELRALLDQFKDVYKNQGPHRALDDMTPQQECLARPKAVCRTDPEPNITRPLNNKVDPWGKVSIRVARRMRHIGVGREHKGKQYS